MNTLKAELPPLVRTTADAVADLTPGDGIHTLLATYASGDATARVERYDSLNADGSVDRPTFEILSDWNDIGAGVADLQLFEDQFDQLDDILAVLSAARRFIEGLK